MVFRIIPLLFFLLLLPSPSSTAATNILLTGETLPTNTQLFTPNAAFRIHNDCNLALYNPTLRFQSNTGNLRTNNCTLTLTHRGQLLIQAPNGSTIWSSSPPTKSGSYAALLRSDGHVAIYGPSVWSTPYRSSAGAAELAKHSPSPNARNHMFSSQVLCDNSKLASGEHALAMKDDCGLELVKESEGVVWESGTKGKGRNCFVRLDHRGQLAVVDDRFKVVWASKAAEADGFYVLVVQNDGRAAVYGPAIWSTDT
ncbi:mannose-specific lectin 3-like [Dendrobium catenatum]|uniref:Mannose-specific lectin 3 n=1 Tax=Dendrobium catenatum TaxID=906689 RepID=A0A2I0W8G2_9ASPA|nr:mannose-specific lectin 3-like [Dendrobium catenatum]PKU71930.1 Mannose-specific lectin 3 [Dendrobium catenatum]